MTSQQDERVRSRVTRLRNTQRHLRAALGIEGLAVQRYLVTRATVVIIVNVLEERQKPIVISLQNGIDLVIVAAGAVERQTEKDLPGRGDDIIQPVKTSLERIRRLIVPDTETIKPCCD